MRTRRMAMVAVALCLDGNGLPALAAASKAAAPKKPADIPMPWAVAKLTAFGIENSGTSPVPFSLIAH